ncbi:MAG: Flp pilus assembly complex ATPase component TadA [Phycisphaerae bacterium]|nr:Flp pilus assembly complex ATPase component TadA [Phycisphaerae bacterium]
MIATLELLAQLPYEPHYFLNPVKLVAFMVVFAIWVVFAQWVDKDAVAVNTYRTLWSMLTLASGAAALLLGLFIPLFWVGFLLFFIINLVMMVVYILHRNGLVREEDRVFTPTHFRRLKEEGFSGKKKQKEVTERVRITDADRKVVTIPEEEEGREQYRLTQDLVFDALWRRATIVEVLPAKDVAKVSYQIDGETDQREGLVRQEADLLVHFLKQIAGLNMEERRKPQRGQIVAAIGENRHKIAVRTDGSTAGEKLTLRIFYNEETLKVPDLGFNPKQLEVAMALREVTPGMILLTAPSGHGLTTTIYSFTRTHDRFLQNVQTIEFEKEMEIDNVTQKVFSASGGTTFTEQLLKLVRSDPDIIVLPELRERESAAIAAQAAAQKQKVYVGLMAVDIFDALRKWMTLVGDKGLVAKSLLAVGNQRLVRILCDQCKQAYKPDAQMMRKLNLPADKALYRKPEPEYDKHGNEIACQACQGTGYVGRTAVFDWLTVDDGLREVLRRSTSMNDIQNYVLKKGEVGLQAQALQKVLVGVTSIQEVARAVRQGNGASPGPRPRPKPRGAGKPDKPSGRR